LAVNIKTVAFFDKTPQVFTDVSEEPSSYYIAEGRLRTVTASVV
jgi:hypothetical protein